MAALGQTNPLSPSNTELGTQLDISNVSKSCCRGMGTGVLRPRCLPRLTAPGPTLSSTFEAH